MSRHENLYRTIPEAPKEVEAVQYTGPESVDRMMELWGTRGFNNDPLGLLITWGVHGSSMLRVQRSMWVVKQGESFNAYTNTVFKQRFEKVGL